MGCFVDECSNFKIGSVGTGTSAIQSKKHHRVVASVDSFFTDFSPSESWTFSLTADINNSELDSSEGLLQEPSSAVKSKKRRTQSFHIFHQLDEATAFLSPLLHDLSKAAQRRKPKKSVRFNKVEIREYGLGAGDHPDCTDGVPLTLAWEYVQKSAIDVNRYETKRIPHRRHVEDLILSKKERREKLSSVAGLSDRTIFRVERSIDAKERVGFFGRPLSAIFGVGEASSIMSCS